MSNINVNSLKNWDNWNKYTDNDGEILRGKIAFYVKDGSSLVPVFDSEGTALPNPIFTDEAGRTAEQVFLSSPEVLIRYSKYIGNTDMTTDVEDNFVLQYTSDWSNKININVEYCVIWIVFLYLFKLYKLFIIPFFDKFKNI